MAINTGVNASKVVGYVVESIPTGVDCTKLVGYAVLGSPPANPPAWPSFAFVDGTRTFAYSQQFTPTGTTPITVAVTAGALPGGLALSLVTGSTYKISGTPTVSGTFAFSLTATSAYGAAAQAFSILINPLAPSWPAFTFAGGVVGLAYEQRFTPVGGTGTTVTVFSGSLPPGLTLSLVSGETYRISGTPTTAGPYSFTLRASNVDGDADQASSITITAGGGGSAGSSMCFAA
jgi:hypothetical protein